MWLREILTCTALIPSKIWDTLQKMNKTECDHPFWHTLNWKHNKDMFVDMSHVYLIGCIFKPSKPPIKLTDNFGTNTANKSII